MSNKIALIIPSPRIERDFLKPRNSKWLVRISCCNVHFPYCTFVLCQECLDKIPQTGFISWNYTVSLLFLLSLFVSVFLIYTLYKQCVQEEWMIILMVFNSGNYYSNIPKSLKGTSFHQTPKNFHAFNCS